MRGCEGRDREEFVALCPKASAIERSFYRWQKDAKSQHDLAEGVINEDDNNDYDAAPVVERDQTEMKFISTTKGNGQIYHQFSNNLYRFYRQNVSLNGRANFTCSFSGCKAHMRAKYTSKKTRDEEEPMLDRSTVPLLWRMAGCTRSRPG